jgi:hypothetical protein
MKRRAVGNPLFRQQIPCSERRNSLFGGAREFARSALKVLRELTPGIAESAPKT